MKILYLPVETVKRELDSKLAIGLHALELDQFDEVVIGKDSELFLRIKVPGVILLKSAASFESNLISKLKERGHIVYSLDEEGIVPPLNDPSINNRFSKKNLDLLDGVLCNGPLELQSFPSWVRESDKIIMSGNPRFDFYKKENREYYSQTVSKIRAEIGEKKIILIASRFGDVNIVEGQKCYDILANNGFLDSEESKKFFLGFLEHSEVVFNSFLDLPSLIADRFPECIIVVRPHPSESHIKWNEVSKQSNIVVRSDYDIGSWLACSECLIHNGCTTAIEASVMEVPVLSYLPAKSLEFDLHHPNEIGYEINSASDLLSALENIINGSGYYKGVRDLSSILTYDIKNPASKLILNALGAKFPEKKSEIKGDFFSTFYIYYAKCIIKLFLDFLGIKKEYKRVKYPFLSRRSYFTRSVSIAKVFNLSVRFSLKKIGVDLISIKKKKI